MPLFLFIRKSFSKSRVSIHQRSRWLSDSGIAADSDIMKTVPVLSVRKYWIHNAIRTDVTKRYDVLVFVRIRKDWILYAS
jgi:hypothetical protein